MASGITISGAVSGLDTASLINQLVQVQQNQQTMLATQQSKVQKTSDAYGSLITQLKSLSSLTSDLARTSAWQGTTATSSNTTVTATTTSNVSSAITFDVTDIARAHTVISTADYGSLTTVISSGALTLHNVAANTDTVVSVGTGSLSDVVSAINSSGTGYTAAAVQTSAGHYRLQVASATTGEASEFTLTGPVDFTAMPTLTTGSDAQVRVGSGANAYDATSSTNTFSSLVAGISFTVSKAGENGVTVSSGVDGAAIATKVSKMVDAANAVLTYINQQTAYTASTKTGGTLLGEGAVRALQQNILSAVSSAGAAGVHVTRDGTVTFSQTEFTAAYLADPAAVAQTFGAQGTFARDAAATSTTVTFAGSTDSTRAGAYGVNVTSAAQRETWSVTPAGGLMDGHTISLTRGTTSISYTGLVGGSLADTVAAINTKSAEAGLGISASVNGGVITFAAGGYGAAGAFTATLDAVNGTKVSAGADVAGTIDGQTATGLGDVLSLSEGTGGAVGLSVQVSTTTADIAATGGDLGTLTYTPGLAQRLTTLVNDATNSTTGALTTAQQGRESAIKELQEQIDDWNARLATYRETLTRQFTAMETALAQLKSSMSAISGLTASLSSSGGDDSSG
jgi:flagellar hook-associated protein 2